MDCKNIAVLHNTPSNDNAICLEVIHSVFVPSADEDPTTKTTITLFGLPGYVTDALINALGMVPK